MKGFEMSVTPTLGSSVPPSSSFFGDALEYYQKQNPKKLAALLQSTDEQVVRGKLASATRSDALIVEQAIRDVMLNKPEVTVTGKGPIGKSTALPDGANGAFLTPEQANNQGGAILLRDADNRSTLREEVGEAVSYYAKTYGLDVAEGDAGDRIDGGDITPGASTGTVVYKGTEIENVALDIPSQMRKYIRWKVNAAENRTPVINSWVVTTSPYHFNLSALRAIKPLVVARIRKYVPNKGNRNTIKIAYDDVSMQYGNWDYITKRGFTRKSSNANSVPHFLRGYVFQGFVGIQAKKSWQFTNRQRKYYVPVYGKPSGLLDATIDTALNRPHLINFDRVSDVNMRFLSRAGAARIHDQDRLNALAGIGSGAF